MNPSTWKQADLEKILKNQMQIKARPDQPMRACMSAMAKGVTVMMRYIILLLNKYLLRWLRTFKFHLT